MANIIKKVKKFGNSAHIVLSKKLIGEKVRIIPLTAEEVRTYDLQRLNFELDAELAELNTYNTSSYVYKRRLGSDYLHYLKKRIENLIEKIKEAK